MHALTLWTAVLMLAAPLVAGASDGRLEINQACVATGCFAGDAPGIPVQTQANQSYVLTSNIAVGASIAGVTLETGSTLDLNGFEIAGPVTCTGAPAICSEPGAQGGGGVIAKTGSVVRNGTIRGIRNWGIRMEPFVRVEDMRLEQNATGGIGSDSPSTGCVVQDSLILHNGGDGIASAAGVGGLGMRVLRNTIHGNTGVGVFGAISLLVDNAITSNGSLGAELNYDNSTTGIAGNQFWNNHGGNANPQLVGGVSIGTNVCGTDTVCP